MPVPYDASTSAFVEHEGVGSFRYALNLVDSSPDESYGSRLNTNYDGSMYLQLVRTGVTFVDRLPPASPVSARLDRIRGRREAVIRRARELRRSMGDPVESLVRTLEDISVQDEEWAAIIEEPYG